MARSRLRDEDRPAPKTELYFTLPVALSGKTVHRADPPDVAKVGGPTRLPVAVCCGAAQQTANRELLQKEAEWSLIPVSCGDGSEVLTNFVNFWECRNQRFFGGHACESHHAAKTRWLVASQLRSIRAHNKLMITALRTRDPGLERAKLILQSSPASHLSPLASPQTTAAKVARAMPRLWVERAAVDARSTSPRRSSRSLVAWAVYDALKRRS